MNQSLARLWTVTIPILLDLNRPGLLSKRFKKVKVTVEILK